MSGIGFISNPGEALNARPPDHDPARYHRHTIVEAANTMLQRHVSGLPVVDAVGKLVGIISEGDFIRRSEIGTQRKRGRWLS